jgi:hypothetical protein
MRKIKNLSLVLLAFMCSCNYSTPKGQNSSSAYFDIKGYFDSETARLSKLNPSIIKTVGINGSKETKSLKIRDWKSELSAFSDADINRASWKGLFEVSKSDTLVEYTSDHDKVPIKDVRIYMLKGKIQKIVVIKQNKNYLYKSIDTLSYYSGILYRIQKQQNIRFLSDKNYLIEGKIR